MKSFYTIFFSCLISGTLTAQNLIDNWTFEQGLQLYCEDWYDGCGEELTVNCDTIANCFVAFQKESPSAIPEDLWSLRMRAGLGVEGRAETYITGQTGTQVYELRYWMKSPDWTSRVSLGTYEDGQFMESNFLEDDASEWAEYMFRDTLTTTSEDSIAVRLSAGFGDFCICTANFDLIQLTVVDTLTSTDEPDREEDHHLTVFPNPAGQWVHMNTIRPDTYVVSIYCSMGRLMHRSEHHTSDISLDIGTLQPGMYFYRVIADHRIIGQGRLIKE